MPRPVPTWTYRIVHIDNLEHILDHGMHTEQATKANPNFRRIGDSSLIDYRKDLRAPDPPGGVFKDYIPFYLGPRSPMLYQIATGWEDIEKIIGVYSDAVRDKISVILAGKKIDIKVKVSPSKLYYDHL